MAKSYSMNLKADDGQNDNWQFGIVQEELKTSLGIATGIHAVIRTDTGAMVGQYSGEKATPYASIVSAFEAGLNQYGAQFTRERAFVTAGGGRFFADYNIGALDIAGEQFACLVRLLSSHNGTQKAGFTFLLKRLACFNGMMLTSEIFAMFKRHAVNLDLSFLENELGNAIGAGKSHVLQAVTKMQQIELDDRTAGNICSNIIALGKSKGVTERAGHFMFHNWKNPSADETPLGNTMWRLYNAATRWTRDLENLKRFEMGNNANVYISGAFDLAARNESQLGRLLAAPENPLDFAGVTINI